MIRQLFKESLIYAASSALSRGISLLLVPFYTRVLAPADYGMIDILAVIGTLVNIVIVMEISQGVARFFPAAHDQRERIGYAATALWFTVATYSGFFLVAAAFLSSLSAWLLESDQRWPVLLVAITAMWTGGVFYLLQNQMRWQSQAAHYAIVSIIATVVTASVSLVLIFKYDFGVGGVFWGSVAG